MPVLVLRGADFSLNNIGKVALDLPFDVLTSAILENYGITVNEDDSFQKKFNDFIVTLRFYDIVGSTSAKIKSICMPFMATIEQSGSLSYAQINALNGTNFFTDNVDGSLQLDSNGLKIVGGGPVVYVDMTTYVAKEDYHLSGYNNTPETVEYYNASLADKAIFGVNSRTLGLWKQDSGVPALFASGTTTVVGDLNYALTQSL